MAVINTNLVCDLQKAVKVEYIDGVLFSQDNQANKINVTVLDGGEPATLSGTVSANIIRSDGGTVAATGGSITGNVASITLPAAAYAVPGVVSIVVKLTASGVITTIAAIVGNMYRSSTDTAIDPGTVIPSIQTLISQINAAVASIPADYSSLWTKLAPAFSTDASYVAGQYVTYNSGLYRFNTTHTGGWSSSDVTAVNLGGEITDLKSAITNLGNRAYIIDGTFYQDWELGTRYIGDSEEKWANANYRITTKRGTYINFKAGDVVVLKSLIDYQFLVGVSTDNGSTWSGGSNRYIPLTIESNSIGFITITKPSGTAFTSDEIKNVIANNIFILRKNTNVVGSNEQTIDAITMAMASFNNSKIEAVKSGMFYNWITANTTVLNTSDSFSGFVPALKGDNFAIRANVSISYPALYSGIGISIYEYNSSGTTLKKTDITNLSDVILYTVTSDSTSKIKVSGYLTAESGSITTGYGEIFDYKVSIAKQTPSDMEAFLTEANESWEV